MSSSSSRTTRLALTAALRRSRRIEVACALRMNKLSVSSLAVATVRLNNLHHLKDTRQAMEHLRKLVSYFKDKDPETKWPRPSDELYAHLENVLLPHVLRVIQKDNTLLSEVELFPGMKVEWDGTDEAWSRLQTALIYAVLHGDPKEKFGRILESIKSMFPGSHADELDQILND
jgi:hypothetical protein